jgi:hypothetical protein
MRILLALLLIPAFLLTACNTSTSDVPNDTEPATSDESHAGDAATAAQAARVDLADRLSVDSRDIAVEETTAQDWPNACLGLAAAGEMCAEVITPGYAITLVYGGTEYHYRTDVRGTIVRAE